MEEREKKGVKRRIAEECNGNKDGRIKEKKK